MGNCIRASHDEIEISDQSSSQRHASRSTTGKNHPLKKDVLKWRSEHPITEGQLRSKRDEFWDTAPAFEGRKEIWDALRAAVDALAGNDHELAQAIVNGAGITLPHGLLTDCYDELGNRYQLPLYVLAPPTNLIAEPAITGDASDELAAESQPTGQAISLRIRLSTGSDLRLNVRTTDSILRAKRLLEQETGHSACYQRWFCYGQLLTDRLKIQDCTIPKGFVVQVIIHELEAFPTPVEG